MGKTWLVGPLISFAWCAHTDRMRLLWQVCHQTCGRPALQANPEKYLLQCATMSGIVTQVILAQEYLVQVLNKSATCTTTDQPAEVPSLSSYNKATHTKGILCHASNDQCLVKDTRWEPWSVSVRISGRRWPTGPTRRKRFNARGVYCRVQLFQMCNWALPILQ